MFEMRECIARGPEELEDTFRQVIGAASKSVWMSTALHPEFYSREGVKDTVIQAAQRVQEFRLLIDGRVDPLERLNKLPWLRELIASKKIEARHALGEISHWIIVDGGAYARLEKPHAVNEVGTRNLLLVIDADATRFVPSLVNTLREAVKWVFNKWWDVATPLEVK